MLSRLERAGHRVIRYSLRPANLPGAYLSYGAGLLASCIKFRRVKTDVIIADNIESACAAVLIKLLFRIPFVFDFIDDYGLIAEHDGFKARYELIKFLEKRLPHSADLVIIVDDHKRQFCREIGIPDEKILLIPNGTDTEKFRPDTPRGELPAGICSKKDRVIVFVGRLNKYYRIELLIEAVPAVLNRHPDAKFLLVGDGDDVQNITARIARNNLSGSVFLTGYRDPDDIPGLLSCADVCVFPLPDSSALALYEYMACGKPTVLPGSSTGIMGTRNDILPDDCILKVANTSSGLAEGINTLLQDCAMREEMGKRARRFVEMNYSWETLTAAYEKALARVVHKQRGRGTEPH